jgi:SulP family sulfate permease
MFPDLDRGLEWCENFLLGMAGYPVTPVPASLGDRLIDQGFPEIMVDPLLKYLEKVQIEVGGYLIQQGDIADSLYFVETGRVSVYLEFNGGKKMRLQTLTQSIVVGELGLYINMQRTASIIAEEVCTAYRLTKSALDQIRRQNPDLATVVHEFIACLLARRLADTTRLLAAVDQ